MKARRYRGMEFTDRIRAGAGRNRRTEEHLTLQTIGPAPPGKPDEAFGRCDGLFPVQSSISRLELETCRL
jgi:hypothetical protein